MVKYDTTFSYRNMIVYIRDMYTCLHRYIYSLQKYRSRIRIGFENLSKLNRIVEILWENPFVISTSRTSTLRVILILARSRESLEGEGLAAEWRREGEILTFRLFWSNARYAHLASGGFGARSIAKIINHKTQKRILRHNKARDSTEREITWSRGGVSRDY